MGVILKNNAVSTITTAISASDVGLAVAAGTGTLFPTLGASDYFYATLVSAGGTYEVIKVTARVGDTMTIVRAQEGTTAQSFASGSRIEVRVTAASITDMVDEHDQASEIALTPSGYTTADDVQEGFDDLGSSAGTSKIGFLQTGTGAQARSAQDKLREYVSVKDFGAVGDGITDDTAAFQAAFSSGEYGIFVPNGTYVVDSVTGSDIYLFGSGTIKKKAATKGEMIYLTGSNVIEGVTFDYDWTNAAQTLPYFANISLRQDQGVITVRNCKFVRSFARALYVEGATLTLSGSSFSEGAFVARYLTYVNAATNNPRVFEVSDGTTNNRSRCYVTATGAFTQVSSGGSSVAALGVTLSNPLNAYNQVCFAYKVDSFVLAGNGGTPDTDTLGAVPVAPIRINLGSDINGAAQTQLNGYLSKLYYYNLRLLNAEARAFSKQG